MREAVAWHRVCRPGAVVGPQQQYLCSIEDKLKSEGKTFIERKKMEKNKGKGGAAYLASGNVQPTSKVTPNIPSRPASRQRSGDTLLPRDLGSAQSAQRTGSRAGTSERERQGKSKTNKSSAAVANVGEKVKGLSVSGTGSGG